MRLTQLRLSACKMSKKSVVVFLLQTAKNPQKTDIEPMWFSFKHSAFTEESQVVLGASSILYSRQFTHPFLMCNALLIHMRLASLIIHTQLAQLMAHVMTVFHSQYGQYVKSTSVVAWTSSCICNHQAILPLQMIKLSFYAALFIMTLCKNKAPLQWKQKLGVKARPAISCLISQLSVPRCPLVCFTPLCYFRGSHLSLRSFLFNCDEHQSPSVWQTMSVCIPVLYVVAF